MYQSSRYSAQCKSRSYQPNVIVFGPVRFVRSGFTLPRFPLGVLST